tara:strand:+ start:398 stop:3562 length:3165 start_codon:yes stop_codon:yes gene_type:complete
MSEYADITLLNCNRSASVEARAGNNSNSAVFTNPLQQTLRLNVGDKVSLEHSFINEVGAGNSQTIEFKGKARGTNNIATYTDIQYKDHYYTKAPTYNPNYRLGYYRTIETTEISGETAELKDNEAPLIIGYYLTSNEYPNYVQQPRSFAQSHDTRGTLPSNNTHYIHKDGTTDGFNLHTINPNHIPFCDWTARVGQSATIYKQKIENERYTLFIKDKIIYSKDIAGAESQFPKKWHNGIFAECKYHRIREKLDIKVNKGFNTPSAIAEQITQQLTETKNPEIFEILDGSGFLRPITKLIETRTYKPINSQNIYNFNSTGYANYRDTSLPIDNISNFNTQILTDYIATFGYIAVKRPEIFEAGRIMANAIVPNTIAGYSPSGVLQVPVFQDGFEGFQTQGVTEINTLLNPTKNDEGEIITNIPYTEANLKIIRDFFDTQPLYPEMWDDLANTENYKESVRATHTDWTLTPEKSRYLHMNQWDNKLASPTKYQNTFGDDGFVTDGLGLNSEAKSSVPVFCAYNEKMRELFVPYKDYVRFINFEQQLMYGFCVPKEETIYDSNGVASKQVFISFMCETPRTLFTSLNPDANRIKINKGRRIGFDFHSTAFSTAIITPFSGYSNADIGVQVAHKTGASTSVTENYSHTCNFLLDTTTTAGTDITPYMTMSYVGANNPAVAFNGTSNRFEFVRLHTANNIGNKFSAGDKLGQINSLTLTPPTSFSERIITAPQINGDSGDTIYKVSPRPPQFGYSPTFKPYRINNAQYRATAYPNSATEYHNDKTGMNTHYFEVANDNISPFSIFDSHGGIYIDNWGYSEDNWEDSLWDILGFDYYAVASKPTADNVLTKRVNNDNITKLYRPTTNCEIVSTDSKVLVSNQFNANMYYTSLPYPLNIINYNVALSYGSAEYKFVPNNAIGQPLSFYPEIAVKTQSISLTATDLQKSVLKPYYTIRSSILEGHTAIGGNPTGANLPIISVVDKYSAQGDYFFGNPTGLSFTITKPTILSEIVTEICDPDGEYSNVDNTSAVIYKVEKIKRTPTDILQDLLDSGKDQKKKK